MFARFLLLTGVALQCGACRKVPLDSAPLPQRAYVWQREWTPSIADAVVEAGPKLDGFVVLGADISWRDGQPRVLRPAVDWAALRESGRPIGIAMRIDPAAGAAGRTTLFADTARALIADAASSGVVCSEFQVDFDSPDRKLAQYRGWLRSIRAAVSPARFVITALPAWLNEGEFARLASEIDGYVLQVHSVQARAVGGHVALCDPEQAQRWVMQAAKIGGPFVVSLPTYSALVGYAPDGRSLGMALDGVQPSWPAGTRVVEYSSEPAELARLVAGWRDLHPTAMTGIIWYRLPVSGVARNWRWPTFAAVLAGREPSRDLKILAEGANPVDLRLANFGEAEEALNLTVIARWTGAPPVAAEALRGWSCTQTVQEARFVRTAVSVPRLLPGSQRDIGWLRFAAPTPLHVEIIR